MRDGLRIDKHHYHHGYLFRLLKSKSKIVVEICRWVCFCAVDLIALPRVLSVVDFSKKNELARSLVMLVGGLTKICVCALR